MKKKIIIAGGGAFCVQLINRLSRDGYDVYLIDDVADRKDDEIKEKPSVNCVKYEFSLDDEKIRFVFSSIKPDVVVFLGSMSENYDWDTPQKASSSYLSGLSNLIYLASINYVSRFVYLSSTEVYGEQYNETLNESLKSNPEDFRSLLISQGESLVSGFQGVSGMKTIVMRLSNVYGMITRLKDDFALRLLGAAMFPDETYYSLPSRDKLFSATHVNDAVDAVFKASTNVNGKGGEFIIAGVDTDMVEVYNCVESMMSVRFVNQENASDGTNSKRAVTVLTVCGDEFGQEYGYRPIVSIENGLARTHRLYVKWSEQKNKQETRRGKKKKSSDFLHAVLPFIENILIFALFAALQILFSGNIYLHVIDFMLIFIIIIAVTFGLFQATVSVLLACVFVLWRQTGEVALSLNWVTSLDTVLGLLQYFVIGTFCGHMKDRMRNTLAEKNLEIDDANAELEAIYSINDKNVQIKQAFDDRLTNYENSLARIYTVVSQLDSLRKDEIFFSSVGVVSEIMNSSDVSIYMVVGDSFKMCRLVARTPNSTRALKKSIALSDWGDLAEYMENDRIFYNGTLDKNMPMMAAPVFAGRTLVSIIMLWAIDFEYLTSYSINTFLVLSKLISTNIEKAFIYTQELAPATRVASLNVLNTEEFKRMLDIHVKAANDNLAPCYLFEVDRGYLGIEEISEKLVGILRTTDYLGQNEFGKLCILLPNTNEADAKYVLDRLAVKNISVKPVELCMQC